MGKERNGKMFGARVLTGLVATLILTSGCGNPVAHLPKFSGNDPAAAKPMYGPSANFEYKLVPYDLINIQFPYHPEQNPKSAISIRPDGNITLEGIGSIRAVGLTPEELGKLIDEKSSSRLKNPEVLVTVAQYAPRKVYVGGQVRSPGVVLIQEGITPMQAIFERGGFTTTAQVDSVVLIRDGTSENPKIGRINVNQAIEDGVPEQVTLLASDVIYVPRTGVGNAILWVNQNIRQLIPWNLLRPPGIIPALLGN